MHKDRTRIEEILVKVSTHLLKRTVKLSPADKKAIAQYKEWINCLSAKNLPEKEGLIFRKN